MHLPSSFSPALPTAKGGRASKAGAMAARSPSAAKAGTPRRRKRDKRRRQLRQRCIAAARFSKKITWRRGSMNSTSNDRVAVPTEGMLWHDGLLLAPLHFEQLTQRHEELVAYHVRSGFQYAW